MGKTLHYHVKYSNPKLSSQELFHCRELNPRSYLYGQTLHNSNVKIRKYGLRRMLSTHMFCIDEDLNHVFFNCPFSRNIWQQVYSSCGFSKGPQSWNNEISWLIEKFSGKSFHSIIRRITGQLWFIGLLCVAIKELQSF